MSSRDVQIEVVVRMTHNAANLFLSLAGASNPPMAPLASVVKNDYNRSGTKGVSLLFESVQ